MRWCAMFCSGGWDARFALRDRRGGETESARRRTRADGVEEEEEERVGEDDESVGGGRKGEGGDVGKEW